MCLEGKDGEVKETGTSYDFTILVLDYHSRHVSLKITVNLHKHRYFCQLLFLLLSQVFLFPYAF